MNMQEKIRTKNKNSSQNNYRKKYFCNIPPVNRNKCAVHIKIFNMYKHLSDAYLCVYLLMSILHTFDRLNHKECESKKIYTVRYSFQ